VTFDKCNLEGASFVRSELFLSTFRDAKLADADFSFARLHGTDFSKAHLAGVRFLKARIEAAEIVGADGKKTGRTYPASFRSSDLTGAYFSGAVVDGVDMTGANLTPEQRQQADVRKLIDLGAS